ncbi:hypothetical protein BGZ46_009751 [Entomortierella lignicola]|nr:hypothetical protein BGZ46_009751 [Entomortierella lignicola]
MPFPNVATHRKMPHLPNSPKSTILQQPSQEQQRQHSQQIDRGSYSQTHDSTPSNLALTSGMSSTQLLEDSQGQMSQTSGSVPTRTIQDGGRTHQSIHQEDYTQKSPSSSLGHLSPPAASSPVIASHDSKLIKTALYDAFGCLYHPSAHTKHSISSNAIALRSGDVTPLMGLSPKASPLLRPNLGPSAPITPLELAEESTAGGYFALHVPASPALPASSGAASVSTSTRHHGHHHRNTHTASHLSSTFTSESNEEQTYQSLSRRSSMEILDPAEHPVLSSLQALNLSHDRILEKEPSIASPSGSLGVSNAIDASAQQLLHTSPTTNFFSIDHNNDHSTISGFGHQGLV